MFAAAGIVLYKGFFSTSGSSSSTISNNGIPVGGAGVPGGAGAVGAASGEKILPNGTNLDFNLVQKFNGGSKFFNYPIVIPSEVNVGVQDLVK